MHTKDQLAAALRDAGLFKLADQAARGLYHDFLSPLPLPTMTLMYDLLNSHSDMAGTLLARVRNGEFDASEDEAEEWGRSDEAQALFKKIKAS